MPAYSDHLVAFYDILGFSAYVRAHPSADAIHELFSEITSVASVPKASTEYLGQRYTHFSDTVIRTTPFDNPKGGQNRFGILFQELCNTVHFQMELVWREMAWLRGALTYGQAYHDEFAVYGPAVIRAYELEKEVAVFPRIIVDPALLAFFETSPELQADHLDLEEDRESVMDQLRRGDDGVWFVDYLRAAQGEEDHAGQYPEFLARHKRMVLKTLGGKTAVDRILQKYTWLARYHNTVISEFTDDECALFDVDRARLLITPKEAPLLHDPRL